MVALQSSLILPVGGVRGICLNRWVREGGLKGVS